MKKKAPFAAAAILALGLIFNSLYHKNFTPDISPITESTPSSIANIEKEGVAPHKYIDAYVVRVVDGDTVEATYKKKKYTVRLLDVDTPESVKHGVPVQPFGIEASSFTKKLTLNKPIKLVFEKGLRDKYGRLLAHVILKDGNYLNALLVRNGYARVEIIRPNNELTDYFNALQEKAIKEKAGCWALPENKQPFIEENGEYIPRYWK